LAWRVGRPLLPVLALLAAIAGAAYAIRRIRRRKPIPAAAEPVIRVVAAVGPPPGDEHVAVLTWPDDGHTGEWIELTAADLTLGREPDEVDVIIDDSSVSRLHARIRRDATGNYWLYDEGSAGGTYLNHDRLGLAPRPLQHNDAIRLGRVTLRFRLELPDRPPAEEE
jgi:hypothetical protein